MGLLREIFSHGEHDDDPFCNTDYLITEQPKLDLSNFFLQLELDFDESKHPRDEKGKFSEKISAASERDASIEPGTKPVPENHVRLYHYTRGKRGETQPADMTNDEYDSLLADRLRTEGIDISKAIGQTYGEPNVVWASAEMPSQGHVYAEFSVARDDPRWGMGFAPEKGKDLREWEKRGNDVYFHGTIKPEEIIAVHEPWHHRYQYIMKPDNEKLREQILAGEHDRLLKDSGYGPAIAKFKKDNKHV